MNLRDEILKEHSKKQTNKIIKYIGDDQKKFDALVSLFLKGEYRVTQRAGWPMSILAIEHPHLISKHLKKLLLNIEKPNLHNAVLRNTLRLLQFVKIPKSLQGNAVETCFRLFNDKKQPIAIQVFAMSVLGNLCLEHPELKNELKLSIEEQLPYGSAGFKSRAKKVIKLIRIK
ncbi:MAG: hypothetical protein ABI763_00245 [Bacteroidota bacterium]